MNAGVQLIAWDTTCGEHHRNEDSFGVVRKAAVGDESCMDEGGPDPQFLTCQAVFNIFVSLSLVSVICCLWRGFDLLGSLPP